MATPPRRLRLEDIDFGSPPDMDYLLDDISIYDEYQYAEIDEPDFL